MWRAMFLGLGLFLLIVGAECLIVDQATISTASESGSQVVTFTPPEWVPWSLMSAGAITMLYSYTLPQKFKG
jgi:hypothetical protein